MSIIILLILLNVESALAINGNTDIPPVKFGVEGAREDMLETANRWHAYSSTPLPPADFATHGPAVTAFPGAEGYGAYSFGGRGGKLYRVTNLNDSGPGSFREAATAEGPRTIIFDVSGTIELESPLRIYHPYVTIAGQTAPGDGITIANRQVDIRTYDVILRHLRFRHGQDGTYHGDEWMLRTRGGNHVIIDHVTISWGVDGNLGVTFVDNVTVQNSVLAKPLWNSIHPKGERGYGALVRGRHGAKYSFIRNLWANHRARVPRPGNYLSYEDDPDGVLMDFRNNVIYQGIGANYDDATVTKYNYVNNYLLTDWYMREESTRSQGYLGGNILINTKPEDQWRTLLRTNYFVERGYHEQVEPFDPGTVTTVSAEDALDLVLNESGARPRDIHDTLTIQEVINYYLTEIEGQAEMYDLPEWWQVGSIDHQDDVGGLPELTMASVPKWIDTNRNGIPDWWEREQGLDSQNPEIANMDSNGNGYTNLEDYINDLSAIQKTKDLIVSSSFLQAESAADQEGFANYFQIVEEEEMGFSYIQAMVDSPERNEAPGDGHIKFHTALEGEINIWLLVNMEDPDSDSFYIGFGNSELEPWWFNYQDHERDYGTWVWVKYQTLLEDDPSTFVATGDDYLTITRRDAGASLDRILFTTDLDYMPADPNREMGIELEYLEKLAELSENQEGFHDYFKVVIGEEGFSYIEATQDSPEREQAPQDGILTFNSDIEGELNIWLLVNMADPNSDSFYIGFGENELKLWWFNYEDHEEDYGTWVWARYEGVKGNYHDSFVGTGDDRLYLTRRESGAKLDRILFTNDLDYVPEDPDRTTITDVDDEILVDVPKKTKLHQNYPNPFNPVTNIEFALSADQHVMIEVFNAIGQRVAVLLDESRSAGTHSVQFGHSRLPSGMYLYRMQTENMTKTRKMLLIK